METRPPEIVASLVRVLVPPASREHVLGDLQERYRSPPQYLADALKALPFIIASRLRRTTHPLGLLLAGAFFYWAVFWGNRQESWVAALIPTLTTLVLLAVRDVYRALAPRWARVIAIDIAVAASGVLLSQLILAATAPGLVLTPMTLGVGFPLGFVVLFFVRWQSPTGIHQPRGISSGISMQELRTEIVHYESTIRRAIRIETGACIFVAIAFQPVLWGSAPLIVRIGGGFTSAAALFIAWHLYRHARVQPIPENLGFTDSIAAYRNDLERRRRMSRTYGWWYVAPLAMGIWLMGIAPLLQRPDSLFSAALGTIILAAVSAILVLVHRGLAQKAQQRIDQLGLASEKTQG